MSDASEKLAVDAVKLGGEAVARQPLHVFVEGVDAVRAAIPLGVVLLVYCVIVDVDQVEAGSNVGDVAQRRDGADRCDVVQVVCERQRHRVLAPTRGWDTEFGIGLAPLTGGEDERGIVDERAGSLDLDHELHCQTVGLVRVDAVETLTVWRVVPELVGQHSVVLDDVHYYATVGNNRDAVVDCLTAARALYNRTAVDELGSRGGVGIVQLEAVQKLDDSLELLVSRIQNRDVYEVIGRHRAVVSPVLQEAVKLQHRDVIRGRVAVNASDVANLFIGANFPLSCVECHIF